MKKELISLKINGSCEPILKKHSDRLFISKPQLIQLLVLLLEEGKIDEKEMKARLLKGF